MNVGSVRTCFPVFNVSRSPATPSPRAISFFVSRLQCCTVSLKGMKGFPESDLMQLFEEGVGSSPVHIKIVDNPNRGQGLAFVKFATPEEAKKVRERRTDRYMEGVTGRPACL